MLRTICEVMTAAQRQQQRLLECDRAWRPRGGWRPASPIVGQLRAGLALQRRELNRCAGLLLANFAAANDEGGPAPRAA